MDDEIESRFAVQAETHAAMHHAHDRSSFQCRKESLRVHGFNDAAATEGCAADGSRMIFNGAWMLNPRVIDFESVRVLEPLELREGQAERRRL